MEENFYSYQRTRLLILFGWGLASVLSGVGVLNRHKFWRQFWLQNLSWGAIDALLAASALRSGSRKLKEYPENSGSNLPATIKKDIRSYHKILVINLFLDIAYLISGEMIRRKGNESRREDWQGIGVGFLVQGLFLFVYDLILVLELSLRWLGKAK